MVPIERDAANTADKAEHRLLDLKALLALATYLSLELNRLDYDSSLALPELMRLMSDEISGARDEGTHH